MSLFDSIKNVFGKSESGEDVTVSPSQLLREAGVDPSELSFAFGSDGSISVSGSVSGDADRQTILDTLSGIPGINRVDDQMTAAAAAPATDAIQASTEDEPPLAESPATEREATGSEAPVVEGGRTYTVQSGDTLWKIADEMYGDGSKYMKIFESNSDLLEHPDRIFPGQELSIPNLKD